MNRSRQSTAAVVATLAVALAVLGTPAGAQSLQSGVVTAFSGSVSLLSGQAVGNASVALPSCPTGELFLIQSVMAAPDPRTSATSLTGTWAIIVAAYQHTARGFASVPLTVYGLGAVHAEIGLPGGQPTYGSGLYYTVSLPGGSVASASVRFNVHFSGACGKPSVTP